MEGRRIHSERENRFGYTECDFDKYQIGSSFFYQFRIERQNVRDVVSSVAKRFNGSTYVCAGNVAMGTSLWRYDY